ncbi:MAG: accessory factor UbiK family protein [Gammaproteobacteria bacterium]
MIDKRIFEEISQQISKLLPQAEAAGDDMKKSVAAALQKGFSRLDLLTREEFDSQLAALARAEERINALEMQITQLEERIKLVDAAPAGSADN